MEGHMAMYRQGNREVRPTLAGDESSAVRWPMVFLYDEVGQSDFVEEFDERCALENQLQIMFPPDRHVEWDEEGKYVWDRLVCYFETLPSDGARLNPGKVGHLLQ